MVRLHSLGDMAALLDVTEQTILSVTRNMRQHCHLVYVTDTLKPDKPARKVCTPGRPLRRLQNAIYQKFLLPNIVRCPNTHGGVRGRNTRTCVAQHRRQRFFYSGDIKRFYPNIHYLTVKHLFLIMGCSDEVASAFTRLCTHDYRLEQGFITSPILADRLFLPADRRIIRLCNKLGLTYTRFVDDITISSPFDLARRCGIPNIIADIILDDGFVLNQHKNEFGDLTKGATLLGLQIKDRRIDVPAAYYAETVARLTDLRELANGGTAHVNRYLTRSELLGRVQYICSINPCRRPALMQLWQSLDWPLIEYEARRRNLVIPQKRFQISRENPNPVEVDPHFDFFRE